MKAFRGAKYGLRFETWLMERGLHNGPLAAVLSVKLSKCHHLRFQHTPNRWLPESYFVSPTQDRSSWEKNLAFSCPPSSAVGDFCEFMIWMETYGIDFWKYFEMGNYQNAWTDTAPMIWVRDQLSMCICVIKFHWICSTFALFIWQCIADIEKIAQQSVCICVLHVCVCICVFEAREVGNYQNAWRDAELAIARPSSSPAGCRSVSREMMKLWRNFWASLYCSVLIFRSTIKP